MKAHTHFSQLAVFVRLDEDIRTCTFHAGGEVNLQFRVISGFECRNAKHRRCVITWTYNCSNWSYNCSDWRCNCSNCFTDSSVLSQRYHGEACRNSTAEDDLVV